MCSWMWSACSCVLDQAKWMWKEQGWYWRQNRHSWDLAILRDGCVPSDTCARCSRVCSGCSRVYCRRRSQHQSAPMRLGARDNSDHEYFVWTGEDCWPASYIYEPNCTSGTSHSHCQIGPVFPSNPKSFWLSFHVNRPENAVFDSWICCCSATYKWIVVKFSEVVPQLMMQRPIKFDQNWMSSF